MNQTNFQYMHYRSANGTKGGATVAILPDATTKTALFAISRCGPGYLNKIGRSRNQLMHLLRDVAVTNISTSL